LATRVFNQREIRSLFYNLCQAAVRVNMGMDVNDFIGHGSSR
jgi:hypothetical protein